MKNMYADVLGFAQDFEKSYRYRFTLTTEAIGLG